MSGGDARAELGVRPLLGVSGYWMARLDPKRSCGKDTGVRGAKASPAASNSARTELTCGSARLSWRRSRAGAARVG